MLPEEEKDSSQRDLERESEREGSRVYLLFVLAESEKFAAGDLPASETNPVTTLMTRNYP